MRYDDYPSVQHAWFEEVWNRGNEAAIDDLCTDDVVGHGLTDSEGNPVRSREAFKGFYRAFKSAFPDIRVDVEDSTNDGENYVVRCRVRGQHAGPGFLCDPSGAEVEFTGICWVKVRDGRIAESWNSFDFLTLAQQVGAVKLG